MVINFKNLNILLGFLYKKILLILKFLNNYVSNYIQNITETINDPTVDFVERFFNNIIIFIYWKILYAKITISKLIENIIFLFKLIEIKIYELTFGNTNFKLSTPNLFYSILKDLPNNSKILDFGCGSGISYKKKDTIDLIIKKNHMITGIDINSFAINKFEKKIKFSILDGKINLKCGNIFTEEFNEKFDYVIFSESAPLLTNQFLIKVINHIKHNLLNSNGKIIFINNLVENQQFFVTVIKPKIKYITTLDFGRILTMNEFEKLASDNNMKIKFEVIDSMTVESIAKLFKIDFIYKIVSRFGFKNYDVKEYKITME